MDKENIKVGDIARCIDVSDIEKHITIGRYYKCLAVDDSVFIKIVNDNGIKRFYLMNRFKHDVDIFI